MDFSCEFAIGMFQIMLIWIALIRILLIVVMIYENKKEK